LRLTKAGKANPILNRLKIRRYFVTPMNPIRKIEGLKIMLCPYPRITS
jgi:hypothetical protein